MKTKLMLCKLYDLDKDDICIFKQNVYIATDNCELAERIAKEFNAPLRHYKHKHVKEHWIVQIKINKLNDLLAQLF